MTFDPPKQTLEPFPEADPSLAIQSTDTESTGRQDLAVTPAKPAPASADFVGSLTPYDLEVLVAAPLVLQRDGLTWFEIGAAGIEISAMGDLAGFTHRSKAAIDGTLSKNRTGFGLPAGELASVARWSLKQRPVVGVDLHCSEDGILARPDATRITSGHPLAGSFFVPESFDDIPAFLEGKLPHFPLTAYFDRPSNIVGQDERTDLGPINLRTLRAILLALQNFVPNDEARPDLEILELANGIFYGGGQDVAFIGSAPSLAGVDLSFARRQLRPALRLLQLVSSEPCQLVRSGDFHIFSNSRTTFYAKVPDLQHPLDGPRLLEQQPTAGVMVEVDALWNRLEPLREGRGKFCKDAFLHLSLAGAKVQLEGRRPSDGQQTVYGYDVDCQPDQLGLHFDLLMPLTSMEKALAGFSSRVSLQVTKTHLWISGFVPDAPSVGWSIRLPMREVISPDRLAWQVRQLGKAASTNSPRRKRRAAA